MTIKLDHVSKRVGAETHLYDIDLELSAGLNVLIGATLAGKTSLMRMMAGLDRPSSGRVLVDGRDVTHDPVQKRSVAMVYQQFINYPSFTVYNNIASPLKLAGMPRSEIERKVNEVAEMLHLEPFLKRLPGELSGGQQQRTAMARALVKDADLLLFDEPLVNLDYKLREELRAEMQDIFARRQTIVVYATTEPLEALMLGGRAIVLDAGRLLQQGPTLDVYHNPASVRVAEVFSDPPMNMIEADVSNGEVRLGESDRIPLSGHLSELTAGRYRIGIRASHLSTAPASDADVKIGTVTELSEVNGSETFIHVDYRGASWVVQEEGVHVFGSGKELPVFLDPHYLFVYSAAGELVAAPLSNAPAVSAAVEVNDGAH